MLLGNITNKKNGVHLRRYGEQLMTNEQWQRLLAVLDGEVFDPLPAAFIIDSPWLPNWAGISILDYYSSETKWLDANLRALETFPEV